MVEPTFYVVSITAEGPSNLGHEKRNAQFVVPGTGEADAIGQMRMWIMMALGHQGPVLMRHVEITARYCEGELNKAMFLENFNPNDWLRFIPEDKGPKAHCQNCGEQLTLPRNYHEDIPVECPSCRTLFRPVMITEEMDITFERVIPSEISQLTHLKPIEQPGALPRTPEGFINNCALAVGAEEYACQMCTGTCPDRANPNIAHRLRI